MPTQLLKQNVFKYSADKKQIPLYCCEAFTLFEKSFRKIRQIYLTDQAIYVISRKKLKIRILLNQIVKVYVGLLAGQFFIVTSSKNIVIDCVQGRSNFIQSIQQASSKTQIQYVNYTILDFLFEKHKKINSKVQLTQYDPNQKKIMLRFFNGQKLNLKQLRIKWQQRMTTNINLKQNKQKDYELIHVILVNTYWQIFAAKHIPTKKQYTIKVYSKKFIGMQETLLNSILNERQFLENLSTSYTPSLVKAFYSNSNIYLVCDYFNGFLLEVFKNIKKYKIVNLLAQIVISIGQLHQAGLVYGNTSQNGIMITLDGFVFLYNLGLSILKGKQGQPENQLTPPEYWKSQKAQFGWDWWNLGQLIFEIVEKRKFYEGMTPQQIENYQKDQTSKVPQWLNRQKWQKDENLFDLFEYLIKKQPRQRLGYKNDYHEILHHKYFQQWLKENSKSSIMRKQCPPIFRKISKPVIDEKQSQKIKKEFISDEDWSEMNSYLKDYQYSRHVE